MVILIQYLQTRLTDFLDAIDRIKRYFKWRKEKRYDEGDEKAFTHFITEGRQQGFCSGVTSEIYESPDWLDENKLRKGQKFATEYFSSIVFCDMISLYLLFAHSETLETLITTGKSSTVISSCNRYLSTVDRVSSWYQYDLLDPGSPARRNIKEVCLMHNSVCETLGPKIYEVEKEPKLDLTKTALCLAVCKDSKKFENSTILSNKTSTVRMSQFEMAITQFCFLGLIVLHPDRFGISCHDKREIENFIHLWRFIGHLLGLKDEFNLCSGTLEQVENKMELVLNRVFKPSLQSVNVDWEYMSRIMNKGISLYNLNFSFEVTLVYLLETIDMKASEVRSFLTWYQVIHLGILGFTFKCLIKIKVIRDFISGTIIKRIEFAKHNFHMVIYKYRQRTQGQPCSK